MKKITPFIYFEPNDRGRDFVVGDIHGMYDMFMETLKTVDFDESVDRVFSVGDLVDRGPDSYDSLILVRKPWFHSITGNHEFMLVEDPPLHRANGGRWVREITPDLEEDAQIVCRRLPYAIQVGQYGLLHADFPHKVCNDDWNELVRLLDNPQRVDPSGVTYQLAVDEILWSRHTWQYSIERTIKNIKRIYVGHTILKTPTTHGNIRFIDTGSFLEYYARKNPERADEYHEQYGCCITIEELKHD